MKKLFAAMIFICLTCAGCFQGKSDVIITSDGAVVQHNKFIGNPFIIRQIEDWKDKTEKLNPNVKAKVVVEGDLRGYEFRFDYPNIETFAKSTGNLYRAQLGKNRGISRHETWFFDEYDFDFYFESSPLQLPPETEFMTQTAFRGIQFDVTLQLPYSAEKNNADKISGDGKFLQWNLAPVLIHGGEKFMQTRFKIWHKDKIALTAIVDMIFFAATIFFFRKARAEESENIKKDLQFKRNVFAGLFITLAVISTYMILAPVNFTDTDIISIVVS